MVFDLPGMSGIELIEAAKKLYSDISYIIMSGYTEFKYAQQAVHLGVHEYLVKPIQKDDINRILEKLDAQFDKKNQEVLIHENLKSDLIESKATLQQKYLSDVWETGKVLPITNVGGNPIIDLSQRKLQIILFNVNARFSAQSVDTEVLNAQTMDAFDRIYNIHSDSLDDILCVSHDMNHLMLLIFNQNETEKLRRDFISQISSELSKFNDQNLFARISASSSDVFPGIENNILEAVVQAETAMKWRFEQHDSYIIQYKEDVNREFLHLAEFSQYDELHSIILEENRYKIRLLVTDIWKREHTKEKVSGRRFIIMMGMTECINHAFANLPGVHQDEWVPKIEFSEVLSGGDTTSEIAERIIDMVENKLDQYDDYAAKRENTIILKAKIYIEQNYPENLSLNSVSEFVELSPAYFSTLFKAETGSGFANYLQKIRVEAAKRLLKTTNMKVYEIAEHVGYHDIKSFNKIFQNETHVKPTAYRKFYS